MSTETIIHFKKESDIPEGPREGHCCALSSENKLYIFGGLSPKSENLECNKLLEYDCYNGKWATLSVTGDIPPGRMGACMASVKNKLYLFGGLNQGSGWMNDFYEFNIEGKHWKVLEPSGERPLPRDKCTCAVVCSMICIFGGFGPQGMADDDEYETEEEEESVVPGESVQFGWFNDLFLYNIESNSFSCPMQLNLGVPTPRAAHTMVSYNDCLIVFGGRDSDSRRNDISIFNTKTRKWLKFEANGTPPEPRSFHTATIFNDKMIILCGRGMKNEDFSDTYMFDITSKTWSRLANDIDKSHGRCLHSACCVNDKLYIVGGSREFNEETQQSNNVCSDVLIADISCLQNTNDEPIEKKHKT
ncbi:DgyrCDS11747 [Dimorphilus gyrociliatus]|uniref:DgyrCDS11747 n=1 Tax=Dimorphilus gyrociliatus TaxID=2664684 RepID=A0A7I8W4A7_9ANNE|nr:DgyrCDS11747 [Dimorphilus gyrociliatus]